MRTSALLLVAACGGGSTAVPADGPSFLFATNLTFQPYETWTSFHSDGPPDDGSFPPIVLGPREQYINNPPPHGAKEFPVGTVIVENRTDTGTIFAGVKRIGDGTFNPTGAIDWEWFELEYSSGVLIIQWRGLGPPNGESYGGDPNTCNDCHKACGLNNDYVCSPKLQLANF